MITNCLKNKISYFIINMEKDATKLKHMKSICKQQGILPKIIRATEGKKLKNKFTVKHHSFNFIHHSLSLGEIGCAYSHIKVYKEILQNKLAFSLILEDDINFSGNIRELITKIILTDETWDIVHLGHHPISSREKQTKGSYWNRTQIHNSYKLLLPCEPAAGTYGYLITYNGAKKILSQLDSLDKPIDHYTGSTIHCNFLLLSPPAITINKFYSDNHNDMQERVKLSDLNNEKTFIIRKIKKISIALGIYEVLDAIALKIILTLKSIIPTKRYK